MRMKFSVVEEAGRLYTHHLFALCEYLTTKAITPFLKNQGVDWDRRFEQFFSPAPGCNPYEPVGEIYFHAPAMFAGQLGEMENCIRTALNAEGIRTSGFTYMLHEDGYTVKTVIINIIENPTAQKGPPEVVMSDIAARIVLRDVLGFSERKEGFEISVVEVLNRVENVTEETIKRCSSSPLKDSSAPRKVRPTQSPVVTGMIQRCLGELRGLARWARDNNHNQLSVEFAGHMGITVQE